MGLQVREGIDSPQDLKIASFKITAIAMDGERRRGALSKRGSVRYASAPSTARAGNTDAHLNILRGWGGNHPWSPWSSALYPLSAGKAGNEAGSPVREGGVVHCTCDEGVGSPIHHLISFPPPKERGL